ncbi:phosphoribosyl-ATP diphosphatase [Veillonella sp. YH-vei2232]|jgi:phosphoribosyl-ATP pyrophosphohydrolase|uniref:Phosphoribosyl-ATP pyrophosphatase n=1 Tax=Veillonella absiana TaxID=3079305 RepID=A0ABU3Z7W7_9FIRM|nr:MULTISPECIES: phosphoribosyl-ATP diphosphatase [unclassified Veillonella]MDV5062606.1 phosphoribosyl-ATP diphosphatase [Veillonella sp. YH-vei2232]MDV5088015.1 phosphoribosyl-ATP diphosphatase [Veillonella sp. YH-vei2233]NCB95926.1 phosphoribosyl-ATP diphosphatase [Negativicutes bacterium]
MNGQELNELYAVIADRKANPKEGSYTNYLFDKGLDKILKKVGEETTEVVIAAKNTDPQEVIYESADLLYHLLVLLVEKGIPYEAITEELAKREGLVSKTTDRPEIDNL